ncbi:MAG TPA: hypothetical protein VKU80_04200 [Planctomycetota bacterium]|nr:hypothetical protein [Planctomycetota bacterium]
MEKSRKAHRAANRLIVGAGILLAEAGVRPHAPEMKALSAALRAVNRAWAELGSGYGSTGDPEISLEDQGFRRLAP